MLAWPPFPDPRRDPLVTTEADSRLFKTSVVFSLREGPGQLFKVRSLGARTGACVEGGGVQSGDANFVGNWRGSDRALAQRSPLSPPSVCMTQHETSGMST